jgi:hypothetical protein
VRYQISVLSTVVVPTVLSIAFVSATPLYLTEVTSKPVLGPSTPTHTTRIRFDPPPIVWLNVRVSAVVVADVTAPKPMAACARRVKAVQATRARNSLLNVMADRSASFSLFASAAVRFK